MGNTTQFNAQNNRDETLDDFQDKYKFLHEINDPSFDLIQIYEHKENGKKICIFNKPVFQKEKFHAMYQETEIRLRYQHPNLLTLLGYQFNYETNLCGNQISATFFYQYETRKLEEEINERMKRKLHYEEEELWYIIDSLCSFGLYMQEREIFHGDIQPKNIFITDDGELKLADHGMTNQYFNSYIKQLMRIDNKNYFLSPQQTDSLNMRLCDPEHNCYKSEVWAIGMTILELATLKSSEKVYHSYQYQFEQKFYIQFEILEQRFQKVLEHYSLQFANILRLFLEPDELKRPDFIALVAQRPLYGPEVLIPLHIACLPPPQILMNQADIVKNSQIINKNESRVHHFNDTIQQSTLKKQNKRASSGVFLNDNKTIQSQIISPQGSNLFQPYGSAQYRPQNNFAPHKSVIVNKNIPQFNNQYYSQVF